MAMGLLVLLMPTVLMAPVPSKAHEDSSRVTYPYSCCGNFDCGLITNLVNLPNGNRVITIKIEADGKTGYLKSAVFPQGFPTLPALDDQKEHACISYTGKPLCLFLQGGF